MGRSMGVAIATVVLMLHAPSSIARGAADDAPRIVVAILEPSAEAHGPHELGYSVSLGRSRFERGDEVLKGLADARGKRLAILVHEDVSMGAIMTVVSLASKAGYLDYVVFAFDPKRKGMAAVPGFKWVDFSADPETVEGLLR
ncbi:MAG: hypothetical protein FJ108_11805 [Deltaproteobacteria bacterium]|nr:hypothetical protein [Deltaproteobacteria bacterium]